MSKLFNFLKPVGNPSTSGFDLSKNQTFSFASGMIQPAFYRMVLNKSHVELKLNSILNTLPMVNQPFSRGKFYVDAYQVPLSMLWSGFNEFYAQAREVFSSTAEDYENMFDLKNVEYQPVFSLFGVVICCYHDLRVIQVDQSTANIPSLTPDDVKNLKSDLIMGFDVHGYPLCIGTLRLLDMFGYGNFWLLCKQWLLDGADLITVCNSLLEDYLGKGATIDFPDGASDLDIIHEFIDGTQFGRRITIEGVDYTHPVSMVSAWPLLAYQKVFADIYRNTFYDRQNVYSYNVDYWVKECDGIIGNIDFTDFEPDNTKTRLMFWSIFELHYRQFKNDMFTSLLPDSQFGDVSTVSVGDSDFIIYNKEDLEGIDYAEVDDFEGSNSGSPNSLVPSVNYSYNKWKLKPLPSFSVLAQRRAEALQRYKERYLRAGNRLSDQFKSMFGQVPKYLDDKYCVYLGSLDSSLNNNPVPSTSDSGAYTVGERASYGTSQIQGSIKCDVRDMSILMVVIYYLPEADYESFNIDGIHTKLHYLDLPQIEFENLGLAPVYRHQLSLLSTRYLDFDGQGSFQNVYGNPVIGYAPPYLDWKTDVDRIHGEFGHTNYLNGVFSSWVTSRGNVSMRSLSDYYVSPEFLNSIMVSQFNGQQSHDPFLSFLMFDCKVVQPLTVTGLPIWN